MQNGSFSGIKRNKNSAKPIVKIKLDLKSEKYFKDEASREHVHCFKFVLI